jgi:hypothetical protein
MLRRFAFPVYDTADGVGAGAPVTPDAFSAFEASENAKATGEPDPTPAEVPVESEDDEPEPAPAPVSAAAPTPEKPVSKRQQQINDLIRKQTETDLRNRALEAEMAALKAAKAEPKAEPAAAVAAEPIVDPKDPEPQEADFEDYRKFVQAVARWEIRQSKREADAAADVQRRTEAAAAQRDSLQQRTSSWVERRDAFAAANPDFTTKALPFLDHVTAGTPIGDALLDSDVGPQMALYLATHPDEADRIARLAPISALRALGKLEAQFDSPETTSASASAGPAAKTVTSAPAPPMTLTSRSAIPADPAAAAFAAGDFERWEAEENRKALAAAR